MESMEGSVKNGRVDVRKHALPVDHPPSKLPASDSHEISGVEGRSRRMWRRSGR